MSKKRVVLDEATLKWVYAEIRAQVTSHRVLERDYARSRMFEDALGAWTRGDELKNLDEFLRLRVTYEREGG